MLCAGSLWPQLSQDGQALQGSWAKSGAGALAAQLQQVLCSARRSRGMSVGMFTLQYFSVSIPSCPERFLITIHFKIVFITDLHNLYVLC